MIETGDVVDVIVIHEDDSSLSLLAGEELSVLEVILALHAGGVPGPGFANFEERREPGDYFYGNFYHFIPQFYLRWRLTRVYLAKPECLKT